MAFALGYRRPAPAASKRRISSPMAADARCQIASGSSGMKEAHMAAGEYPSHEAISSSENVRGAAQPSVTKAA